MRGSVYYQSSQLVKQIFQEGLKKEDKINPNHEHYQMVSSFKTMESYRRVWNNFFNYLKEHWNIKDFEAITDEHISAYMAYKIEYYPSKQYLEKLSSAIGKLELALKKYTTAKYGTPKEYNFNTRQLHLDNARKLKIVADGYHNRVYDNPNLVIQNLSKYEHQLAATIQLEGGARSEAVTLIKLPQLKGLKTDKITDKEAGIIETKEKGGKVGDVLVSLKTYHELENCLKTNKQFKINCKLPTFSRHLQLSVLDISR